MKFEKQVRIPKKKGRLLQQLEVLTCLFPEAVDPIPGSVPGLAGQDLEQRGLVEDLSASGRW